jgi:NitT/TauT family transport system substrate-binding protein
MALRQVAVALDWTPNTNHSGFYVAKARGWYADAGLDVQLLSPHVDGYKETPAAKLTSGKATFALTPSETVISFHTNAPKPKLVAIAAALQTSASGERHCCGRATHPVLQQLLAARRTQEQRPLS